MKINSLQRALVIAAYGRQTLVAPQNKLGDFDIANTLVAVTRGRKQDVVVGDECDISLSSENQAVIETHHERRNIIRRADSYKTKNLASNIDLAAIVLSASPPCSEDLMFRMLTACQAEGVPSLIIVNKCDLQASRDFVHNRLGWARQQAQDVAQISVKAEPQESLAKLAPYLNDRRVLLMGESGMGKSSLLNLLVPGADAQTQEFSKALNAGKHTTTFARLYASSRQTLGTCQIIDTPGFQLFGLAHLSITELMHAVPEVKGKLGQCRFSNCLHLDEPGCHVREAVQSQQMDAVRYRLYRALVPEAKS